MVKSNMFGQNLGKSTRVSYANVLMCNTNQNDENAHSAESSDSRSKNVHNNEQNVQNSDEISIESNLHPLYFQNIDHPGLILISKKLTRTDNFGPWK